jgi:branched-chain amino acid transport system ATP-binding protein
LAWLSARLSRAPTAPAAPEHASGEALTAQEGAASRSEPGATPTLRVDQVARAFGSLRAVDGVSFTVGTGLITGLIGANGAGKTTMFDIICGLQLRDSGSISLSGVRIETFPPHRIARLGMARSFQSLELFDTLTVLENVMAGAHRYTASSLPATVLLLPAVAARDRRSRQEAERCLAIVGMSEFRDHHPQQLSFGQRRLVEIARALALRPFLLLMDEPASGLNDTETEALAYLLLSIRDRGVTILIIEHDLRLVMGIADHLVVMNLGRKIAEGSPAVVRNSPDVIAAYLGTS